MLFFGASNIGASNPINISTLNGANGFRLNGTDSNDSSGRIVSAAGDVNGDGIADLLIAAWFADGDGNDVPDSGESYVVFGASDVGSGGNLDLSSLNGANGFVINGVATGDSAGGGLGGGGDVNGDGFDDIVIGAPYAMDGDSATGVSYVVFGGSNVGSVVNFDLSSLDGSNGLILPGVSESDFSGTSVNIVGDVNGDGFDDILIGANGVDPITNNEGASYLVFGGDFSGAVTHQGTTDDDILNGTAGADVMIGGLGVDVLVGNGGGDVMRGGAGDDVLVISDVLFARIDGGTGDDILQLAGSGTTLDLTSTSNLKISGIETIDLTGSGANALTLKASDVLDLSETSNVLVVTGVAGDVVNATSESWTDQGVISGVHTYTSGNATLMIDEIISRISIPDLSRTPEIIPSGATIAPPPYR